MEFGNCVADHVEFVAQVRGEGAHRSRRHGREAGAQLRLPGDSVHRSDGLSEPRSKFGNNKI